LIARSRANVIPSERGCDMLKEVSKKMAKAVFKRALPSKYERSG
jgi:hypothetical protein